MNLKKRWKITGLILLIATLLLLLTKGNLLTSLVVHEQNKTSTIEEQLLPTQKEAAETQATEQNALNALTSGNEIKEELETVGLKTSYARDQLIEAQKAFAGQNTTILVEQIFSMKNASERKKFVDALNTTFTKEEIKLILNKTPKIRYNYTKVLLHTKMMELRKNLTLDILDNLTVLDKTITELNTTEFNFSEVIQMQKQIHDKLEKEQVEELPTIIEHAFTRIEQIQLEATRLRTFIKASQQNIISFVKRHPFGITYTIILLAFAIIIAQNEALIIILKRRIEDYKTEQEVLTDLIKKAQKAYFQDSTLAKSLYEIKIQKYHDKQITIKQQLPVLEKNLSDRKESRKYYLILTRLWESSKRKNINPNQ